MDQTEFVSSHDQAEAAAQILRTTAAVRERAQQLLLRARRGESDWFIVDDSALASAAINLASLLRHHRPKLHSRWRHFEVGGVDRKAQLDRLLGQQTHALRGHALIDLAFVSVLLDAPAGPQWKYVEPATGLTFIQAQGLAVASFHAFAAGLFSSDMNHPLQADSQGLRALVTDHLASALQVSPANPLHDIEERAILLRRLGEVMAEQPETFGEDGRPGGLFDMIISPLGPDAPPTANVAAHDIFSQILMTLSGIWPADNCVGGVPLGDCWRHAAVRGKGLTDGWMPLHQPSQWLTYSLLEPFEWSGVTVEGVGALTALPEYPYGGVLSGGGPLRLRDPAATRENWRPSDEIVIEWRALTVALMDGLAGMVREQLGSTESQLPLACILESGSGAFATS